MSADETTPLLHDERPDAEPTSAQASTSNDPEAAPTETTPVYTTKQLWAIIIPLSIGVFLSAMDQTIIVASYAAIGNELKQLQYTSWIATGYMLTLASFQPLYGKLSDIFGRKSCLLVAYSIFGLGCLFCGLARTMPELILARALAGIGGGGMTTVVSIIMSDIIPIRSRGTWQGILNIIFSSGSMVGAPLGGLLSETFGWRWAFLVQVPPICIAIIAVSFGLHLPHRSASNFRTNVKRVDFAGAFSLVITIFFLLFGLERAGNIQWTDKVALGSLAAFAVMSAIFAFIEVKVAAEPFAPKRIVVGRNLLACYLVNFFGIASAMPMIFHLSLYLQAVQEKSPSHVSLWIAPAILASVAGSLLGGMIMQATGKYYLITVISYVVMLIGTVFIPLFTGWIVYSPVGIIAGFMMASLGNGIGITTTLIAIVANAGPVDQAVATAASYLYRSVGSVVGISLAATIVQTTLRSTLRERLADQDVDVDKLVRLVRESLDNLKYLPEGTQAVVRSSYEHSLHVTFWFCAGTAGLALLSTFFIKEKPLPAKK